MNLFRVTGDGKQKGRFFLPHPQSLLLEPNEVREEVWEWEGARGTTSAPASVAETARGLRLRSGLLLALVSICIFGKREKLCPRRVAIWYHHVDMIFADLVASAGSQLSEVQSGELPCLAHRWRGWAGFTNFSSFFTVADFRVL